ncbi:MAG: hypothetical protein HC936_06225 [Leptolyngbyaceae cyanobacterium SU_3_3]|nr:hypothetical protein [Leptolyngbyaceae cyanobacterium SU_3_3]
MSQLDESAINKSLESKRRPKQKESGWIKFLRRNPKLRWPAFIFVVILSFVAIVSLGYVCWYWWLVSLWNWGFNPPSWKGILSILGGLYLLIIPFMPLYIIPSLDSILELIAEDREGALRRKVDEADEQQALVEKELEAKDASGLIPLIRYSRLQLQAYYKIGLTQTQRSFHYSVIAMWIGFIVIISGLIPHILSYLEPFTRVRSDNIQTLTLAGGIVIEVISALFLWVYRSSIAQLTYFYDRQMYNHNILLCSKIIEEMSDGDTVRQIIVEKVLDKQWIKDISRPELYRHQRKNPR